MSVTATGSRAGPRGLFRKIDTVTLLTFWLILVMGIPSRLIFGPLGGLGAPATMLSVVLFGWYLLSWIHPGSALDRGRQPMRLTVVLWLCVILISYVLANQHSMTTLARNGADRGLLIAAGWAGIAMLAADGIDSLERLRVLIRRIVWGATAMAILGMTQFFTGLDAAKYIVIPGLHTSVPYTDLLSRGSFNRPSSTAIHPIEVGVVLALCLPLAIHQARYAPKGMRVRRWFQVIVILATLPMTVSRSAILGVIVGAVVILSTWPPKDRHYAYLAIVGGTLGLRAIIPGLIGTIRDLFLHIGSDSSANERVGAYSKAAPFIAHHPWFGQGFGTFMPQIYFFTDNQYLGSIIETGIMGLLALISLFITGWCLARRARREFVDGELRHLAQCLAASMAIALVSYATFDALYFPMAAGLTFLLIGCAAAIWRLAQDQPAVALGASVPVPVAVDSRAR